ncbi:MAG: methyltransferase domain-containing protein [Saprospirales bacterium]|nr:methyltransferase domain-containing protein [Saprospirales bacterium]
MGKTKLQTAIQFTKNLFTTGAFTETSRGVELEICTKLPQGPNKVVVEFGMGHGNITKEILRKISPDSKVYSFEVNPEFCEYVKNEIKDKRLVVVNDSAENMSKHIEGMVDAFISSIPFTFIPKEVGDEIIRLSFESTNPGGYFSQVLYSGFHFKRFEKVYDECHMKVLRNIPLEFIYHCKKH